jgi:hypothetical protein
MRRISADLSGVFVAPEGRRVTIADSDASRGLEFDGVVVIELQRFPPNYGRLGPL